MTTEKQLNLLITADDKTDVEVLADSWVQAGHRVVSLGRTLTYIRDAHGIEATDIESFLGDNLPARQPEWQEREYRGLVAGRIVTRLLRSEEELEAEGLQPLHGAFIRPKALTKKQQSTGTPSPLPDIHGVQMLTAATEGRRYVMADSYQIEPFTWHLRTLATVADPHATIEAVKNLQYEQADWFLELYCTEAIELARRAKYFDTSSLTNS